jgi:NAD(P)-dependent dehydrogenase (short-subunit alcohol dehydrogenase family)
MPSASPWTGHVWVSGAASGIGKELAVAAAARGATALSLVDLNTAAAKTVAAELGAAHPGLKVSVFGADVSNYESVKAAVDGAVAAHGPIFVLCVNAGLPCSGLFVEVPPEHGRKMVGWQVGGRTTYGVWVGVGARLGGSRAREANTKQTNKKSPNS